MAEAFATINQGIRGEALLLLLLWHDIRSDLDSNSGESEEKDQQLGLWVRKR